MINFMETLVEKNKEQCSGLSFFDVHVQKQSNSPSSLCLSSFAFSLSPNRTSLLNTTEEKKKKKLQFLSDPLSLSLYTPKQNQSLPFNDLKVVGMKVPSFTLSLFPLTPNPNHKLKPEFDVSILGIEDCPLSLSLSLSTSNPSLKRALPTDIKLEDKTLKRARTTIGIPRRLPISFPAYFPQILAEFRRKIMELGGTHLKLVLKKTLFGSDVNRGNSRLSLPRSQCAIDLTSDEMVDVNRRVYKQVVGVEVMVIEPNCGLRSMSFRGWDTVKSYMLVRKWNAVVKDNGLKLGDKLQIWSFRYPPHGRLGLALVKLG